MVDKSNLTSLLNVSNHQAVLLAVINQFETFELSEASIKDIHQQLMESELAWEVDFKPHLVGNYRNIPTVGRRQPFFENKEYVPHYNIEVAMASHLALFNDELEKIDNTSNSTHLLTYIADFHNIFLNTIHPFADGNGRVCRIIMGIVLMKHQCPPVFVKITSDEDRFDYIHKIVECEQSNSNEPLIKFLAEGMADYLEEKIKLKNEE